MSQEQSPFHTGELAIQERAGVREQVAGFGSRAIRTFMPDQHREFFALLSLLLVGSLDADGYPSASVLWGPPGFARSPEPTRLRIDNLPQADDPLAANLEAGTRLGILGLEWPTRRRNRMNGRVLARDGKGFTVGVEQSFGNCPKYIQARSHQPVSRIASPALQGEGLDPRWLSLVSCSDTLFIASQHADPLRGGVDVSHRGGPPGFLRLGADGRLWMPDYAGNRLFNTLGNLLQDPRCGLLFIDFDNGDLLHLHAEAELFWPGSQPSIPWPAGAERLLALRPAGWRWRRGRLPLAFGEPQPSPFFLPVNLDAFPVSPCLVVDRPPRPAGAGGGNASRPVAHLGSGNPRCAHRRRRLLGAPGAAQPYRGADRAPRRHPALRHSRLRARHRRPVPRRHALVGSAAVRLPESRPGARPTGRSRYPRRSHPAVPRTLGSRLGPGRLPRSTGLGTLRGDRLQPHRHPAGRLPQPIPPWRALAGTLQLRSAAVHGLRRKPRPVWRRPPGAGPPARPSPARSVCSSPSTAGAGCSSAATPVGDSKASKAHGRNSSPAAPWSIAIPRAPSRNWRRSACCSAATRA